LGSGGYGGSFGFRSGSHLLSLEDVAFGIEEWLTYWAWRWIGRGMISESVE